MRQTRFIRQCLLHREVESLFELRHLSSIKLRKFLENFVPSRPQTVWCGLTFMEQVNDSGDVPIFFLLL